MFLFLSDRLVQTVVTLWLDSKGSIPGAETSFELVFLVVEMAL